MHGNSWGGELVTLPPQRPGTVTQPVLLIAEDTDSNFLLVSTLLSKKYKLIRARNGADAVRLHAECNPHLIVMDMKMPVMDGLTAVQKIRKVDPYIPIVAVSALAFASDENRAATVGCNAYLKKPLKAKLLYETIAGLLRNNGK